MIRPTQQSDFEQAGAKLAAELGERPEPEVKNSATVLQLGTSTFFRFRGKPYAAPPLDYHSGLELQMVMVRHREVRKKAAGHITIEHLRELQKLQLEAATLFKRMCRPVGKLRSLLWPITPNPFLVASDAEVAELLMLFYTCRTRSSVRPVT